MKLYYMLSSSILMVGAFSKDPTARTNDGESRRKMVSLLILSIILTCSFGHSNISLFKLRIAGIVLLSFLYDVPLLG